MVRHCELAANEYRCQEKSMRKTIIGMAGSYTAAQTIVEALEREGIVGTQVEVISGAADDISSLDNSANARRPTFVEKIRSIFQPHGHSHDTGPRDQYLEDPDFYASHVRQGRALIVVRMPDVPEADRAAEVLRVNGAFDPGGGDKPRVVWENDRPGIDPASRQDNTKKTIGDDTLTTGGTRDDLEGRGTTIREAE
jgi:hypothetical protein